MSKTRYRKREADTRVNVKTMLSALWYIHKHSGISEPELRLVTKLSRASNIRLLAAARSQYGVKIKYYRDPQTCLGEYAIEDWGILTPSKIAKHIKNSVI